MLQSQKDTAPVKTKIPIYYFSVAEITAATSLFSQGQQPSLQSFCHKQGLLGSWVVLATVLGNKEKE